MVRDPTQRDQSNLQAKGSQRRPGQLVLSAQGVVDARVVHPLRICSPLPALPCLLPSGSLRCSDGFIYFRPYVPVFPSSLKFDELCYLLTATSYRRRRICFSVISTFYITCVTSNIASPAIHIDKDAEIISRQPRSVLIYT
jgi:hypothetical protein